MGDINFLEIFKGQFENTEKIIKNCMVNRNEHAIGFFNILKHHEPKFVINEFENRQPISDIFEYFIGLETCKLNRDKGICLIGSKGSGKTLLFKALKDYTMHVLRCNSFSSYDSKIIIDSCAINGTKCFNEFNYVGKDPKTIYIDDIGKESEIINHYGTKTNVIESFLDERHIIYKRFNKLTHLSTNLLPSQIKEFYGERIADRFNEMFNIVILSSKISYRETK
jgi:DNA replication protein DnaC